MTAAAIREWGGRPRPRPAPWPASSAERVQGDPRRPGGLPHQTLNAGLLGYLECQEESV
jgi:hypothetical protein